MKAIYWNGTGKYQAQFDKMSLRIPDMGIANESHIDLVRNIANLYHDHFNNGGCNWDSTRRQFEHIAYWREQMYPFAGSEGVKNLTALLYKIRELALDYDDNFEKLSTEWEKLADIVISYAWNVEAPQ